MTKKREKHRKSTWNKKRPEILTEKEMMDFYQMSKNQKCIDCGKEVKSPRWYDMKLNPICSQCAKDYTSTLYWSMKELGFDLYEKA